MKRWLKNMIALGFLILFLPYTITLLLNGKQGIHKEEILPELEYQVLYQLMQENTSWMQDGTLELLAILYRSEYYRSKETIEIKEISPEFYKENYDRVYQAVQNTVGKVITIEEEYKELPYHAVSAGVTRDGTLLGEGFSYVTSVVCPKDVEASAYLQVLYLTEEELCEAIGAKIDIEQLDFVRDHADYVTNVRCADKEWPGEKFRSLLHLSSSCFYIEATEHNIRITVKGNGHGFGISLYTADWMIQEGMELEDVIQEFYQGAACITIS